MEQYYRQVYIVIIVFYLKVKIIINGNKQELMIIKELFEGPVGDCCIARNTIKCLLTKLWAFFKVKAHLAGASHLCPMDTFLVFCC